MAIPKSGPIKFSDIVAAHRQVHGFLDQFNERNRYNNDRDNSISGYYRNGGNVADIYDNRNIPLSGPIKFSDFYGSGQQSEYNWPIPELCTDDFIGLAKGIGSWNQVSDSKTEYIGRNNTESSMEIPVYNPEGATITIPALSFEIGSERGPDMKYERILKNTSDVAANNGLPTDIFAPGAWAMTIPKKFKRIRIVAVSGGGSGSVQKSILNGAEMKNKTIKGVIENGYDGERSGVLHNNFSVSVRGGSGGGNGFAAAPEGEYDQTIDTDTRKIVTGGIPTSYDLKSAETPTEYIVSYEADDAMMLMQGLSGSIASDNGLLHFGRNEFPINILYNPRSSRNIRIHVSNDTHIAEGHAGFGEDSMFGRGSSPGREYVDGDTRPQSGLVEVLDTSFGAGGAAGQHGGRGSLASGYTATQAGQSGITGYFGDFEVKGGDILNIRVGRGGRKSKNTYNDYDDILDRETQRISESGYGGNGMVQIIGSHGFAHSELSHPGWVLEDENGDIISSSYATNESSKGVTLYSSSMTSQRTIEVMGPMMTVGAAIAPRIYRLRFSARIGKSGDESLKTRICHVGKKSVKVIPLTNSVLKNPPAQVLYDNPDISPDTEIVLGQYHTRDAVNNEIIDNWYIPQCNISLAVDYRGKYDSSVTFTKSPQGAIAENKGGGPASFVLNKNTPVVNFTMASQEKYVLEKSGISSSASTVSRFNRISTYLRSRQQFQLDERNETLMPRTAVLRSEPDPWDRSGINTWETADMAVSHSGAGGFFLGLDDSTSEPPIKATQIEYDMIGGGRGGRGGSSRPADDDNRTVFPGNDGSLGGPTILSLNGSEVIRTDPYDNIPYNFNLFSRDGTLGLGGRQGNNYNKRAEGGGIKSGNLEVKVGDVLSFVIGAGGAGGREHSSNGWEGLDGSDSPSYYQWKYGGNGNTGGIVLQGILYTESGSHTVTDEQQFAIAVTDNSESLVFGTTGTLLDRPITWPHQWWRDWTISGGRIKELFGSETVRLGENYMFTHQFSRLGSYISKSEFDGGGTMSAYDPYPTYVGNFPELYEKYYWKYLTGRDDDETNLRSNWRLKSDWKEIAKNSTRLNSPLKDYKTYFSCGYRGSNSIGTGTSIPHNYTPPPYVAPTPTPPKKDHPWDINLCFLAGTMVTMEDGSKKAIETIDLGESVKIGGRIFACGKFLSNDLHDYHGIKVSGSHLVLENGKWIQVKDSADSNFISDEVVTTYNFGTENRRLEIEGITFTDYFEIHEKEKLQLVGDEYFNDWQDQDPISKQKTMEIINK